jgi:hypothetical protein
MRVYPIRDLSIRKVDGEPTFRRARKVLHVAAEQEVQDHTVYSRKS